MKTNLIITGIAVLLGVFTSQVQAQWGDFTATFVIDGKAPAVKDLVASKDQQICGNTVPDDSLLINTANGGIADVIVWIFTGPTDKAPPVHESYAKLLSEKVILDNHKCRFSPHVAVLRAGQTLVLKNSDAVAHNTNISTQVNAPVNPIIPTSTELPITTFGQEERLPANVSCSIHPWMTAKLVIKKHPYVGVTDKDGKLTIKNMPVGKWSLQAYHEKSGYVSEVSHGGKATKWAKGRFDYTVKDGANSLGEVKVPVAMFTKP